MRNLHRDVYGVHGSADQIAHTLTGWDWVRIFALLKRRATYFLAVVLASVSFSAAFFMGRVQGKLATTLLDSDFVSAEEFITRVNAVSTEMMWTVFGLFLCHLSNGIAGGFRMSYVLQELRTGFMTTLFTQDIDFYDTQDSSVILSRLQDDVQNAYNAFTEKWVAFARYVYQFLVGLTLVSTMHWKLCIASCCMLPFYAMTQVFGNKAVERLWLKFNERSTDVSAKAHEILSSFRTVRSFDAERREYEQYKGRLECMHGVVCETGSVHGIKEALSTFSMWTMIAVLLFLAGRMAARKEIAPGDIVTLMTMLNAWGVSFAGIFESLEEVRAANVSCAKLKDIFDREVRIQLHEGRRIGKANGRLEFKDVQFRYPTRSHNALDGLLSR
jgi:ABC-type multidrug transport system fused ATPase/permease subunit